MLELPAANLRVSNCVFSVSSYILVLRFLNFKYHFCRCSIESATEGLVADGNVKIEQNRLFGIFPEWGPIFRVTFELKIESATEPLDNDFVEVLRVTDQDADTVETLPGKGIPGVWLCYPKVANKYCGQNSTCLLIESYISSYWGKDIFLNINRDRFISIEIAQWVMDGIYFFQVNLDGELYEKVHNLTPANFTNMNVFTSDNFYVSFGEFGQVKNLELATWLEQPKDCYISKP